MVRRSLAIYGIFIHASILYSRTERLSSRQGAHNNQSGNRSNIMTPFSSSPSVSEPTCRSLPHRRKPQGVEKRVDTARHQRRAAEPLGAVLRSNTNLSATPLAKAFTLPPPITPTRSARNRLLILIYSSFHTILHRQDPEYKVRQN